MRKTKLLAVSLALFLTACGGGGGGDAEPAPAYFSGTYSGNLVKTVDTCFIGVGSVFATHHMRVEGAEVVVNSNALTLRGTPHGPGAVNVKYGYS